VSDNKLLNLPDDPGFNEPWQGELCALTMALAKAGHFSWPEWSDYFAAGLKQAAAEGEPDDGSTYYVIWLAALERFLTERGLADAQALIALKQAWTAAYLETPHGQPVKL